MKISIKNQSGTQNLIRNGHPWTWTGLWLESIRFTDSAQEISSNSDQNVWLIRLASQWM